MKSYNIMLTLSLTLLGAGLLFPRESILFYALLPLGAVAFIFFLIFRLLHEEVQLFDQEERQKVRPQARGSIRPRQPVTPGPIVHPTAEDFAGRAVFNHGPLSD